MAEDLELKAKIDERVIHKNRNLVQSMEGMHKDMEELDKKQALMNKDMEYTKKSLSNIETKLDSFISSAHNKFATKEDHESNKKAIEKVNKVFLFFASIVGTAIIGAILRLIFIETGI